MLSALPSNPPNGGIAAQPTPAQMPTPSGAPAGPGMMEYCFWAFILIAVGRLGELVPGLAALPLGKISLGLALLRLIIRWHKMPEKTPAIKKLAKTAVWLLVVAILCCPFSIWPGASLQFLVQQLPTLLATIIITHCMCRSWRLVRGTLLVVTLSGLVLARAALSSYSGGRAEANTMYDTNDLAYVLVTVLPIVLAFAITARTTVKRVIFIGIGGVILGALLLTQSRGGFLGLLLVVFLVCCMQIRAPKEGRKNRKFLSLFLMVVLGVLVWTQLPHDARERFATVLSLSNDYNLDPTNDKSRGQIWTRGFHATMDRPVGYGPWAFGMVDYKYGGRMMAPHNSYMEALVELGVLGLILFVRMYVLSWRGLARARARLIAGKNGSGDQEEQIVFARALQISLAGNAVAGFFLSMTYATVLWLAFGLSMALMSLVDRLGQEHDPSNEMPEHGGPGVARMGQRV